LTAKAQAHPAWGIAVDRHGQVYFSDLKTIWKIDAHGRLSVFRTGTDHTHELNIDDAGSVYGAENSYDPVTQRFFSAIWKSTPAGDASYLLAPIEHPPMGTSIWKDPDGNSYHFVNHPKPDLLVLKRTPNGTVTALVGSNDALRSYVQDSPHSSGATAFGADGALYFTNGSTVYKLTKNNTLTVLARHVVKEDPKETPAGGTPLFGIAVNAQGDVFVADYGNQRILKIAPDGQLTTHMRAEESWFPTGVAVSGSDLYVLENSFTPTSTPIGTRVRKLSSDGTVSVLATVGEGANRPARETPASAHTEPSVADPNEVLLYALVGIGASGCALSIVVWRIRRKRSVDSSSQTTCSEQHV